MKSLILRGIDKAIAILNSGRNKFDRHETSIEDDRRRLQIERNDQWYREDPDSNKRLVYPLANDSLVMDLGGYDGQWASDIYAMYNCNVLIFEPYIPFAKKIIQRFQKNPKMKVYSFGLGARNETVPFAVMDNASSIFRKSDHSESIELRSIAEFLYEEDISFVDLLKINIEGGEYELLECILDAGLIHVFRNIQVQFHDFIIEDAPERMRRIQERLAITHSPTYRYDFVWENWTLVN